MLKFKLKWYKAQKRLYGVLDVRFQYRDYNILPFVGHHVSLHCDFFVAIDNDFQIALWNPADNGGWK
jgi:hypothetical protein